jgi:hypothetical protein
LVDSAARSRPAAPTVPLDRLPRRGRVRSYGYVESVTIPPPGQAPSFSAVVVSALSGAGAGTRPASPAVSGGGRIRLIWLGQRLVPGIDAGIRLGFDGMVSVVDGLPTMYNPGYEILSLLENES